MPTRRLLVEILADDASLQAGLARSGAAASGFGERLQATGRSIASVGKTLTTHLTLPIVALGAASGKAAVDFQNSMELLHTQAQIPQKDIAGLSKSVLALAGPTATAPDQLSLGLYHLASQGLRGKQAIDALRISAEGAKLGMANLEDITNALGGVISSQIKGAGDYNRVLGQINATVGAGDMHMQDYADAMGTGLAAAAATAHVSLDQINAALATLGDNNIRGAKAGTLMISTLRVLGHQSTAAQGALADLGVSSDVLQQKLATQGLGAALTYLKERMAESGKSAAQVSSDLSEAFGGKQSTGIKILVDELERFNTKLDAVHKGGSSFAKDWEAYTKTTAYHLAAAGAQMQATGVTIGTVLLPVVAKVADVIGNLASKFEGLSGPVKDAILVVGGLVAAIGPLAMVIGPLVTAFGAIAGMSGTLAIILGVVGAVAALVAALVAAVIWPDKLKSVLEHMGLSAHAAGEVVRGLQDVFHVVETAAMALVGAIRDNWTQIKEIITGVVDVVKSVITAWIGVVESLWHTFGGTLTNIARTEWGLIKDAIHNALTVIRGVVEVVTGLIHGDWSKAWQGVKDIVHGVLGEIGSMMSGAVHLLGDLAQLIGEGIYKGILQPIAQLAGDLLSKIKNGIMSVIHTVVGWVVGAASAIGSGIVSGIEHGIGGLASSLASKLHSAVSGALNFVKHGFGIFSPSKVFAAQVGQPIAAGIIAGYLEGARGLPAKLSASVRMALEEARKQVEGYQKKFASTFGTLKSYVDRALSGSVSAASTAAGKQLTAFLAQYQGAPSGPVSDADTAAGKQLAALQAQHADAQRQAALASANDQYSQAQQQLAADTNAGADAQTLAADKAAVVQAQQAVADAQYQIQVAALQQQAQTEAAAANQQAAALQARAAQEAKQATALKAERKHQADQALAALQARLQKEGATHKQAQEQIVKLLKKYGLTYRDVAKDMGKKFAEGLESSIHLTAKAAEELAREIAKYLPHSPAEKGPLSKPIGWEAMLLHGLDSGLKGRVGVAMGAVLGVPTGGALGARAAAGGGGGGGGVVFESVTINVPHWVGSRQELEEAVVTSLGRWARNNGRSDLRALLGAPG